jgi:formylglycine-generating enzyme required for sulfatase activity
MIMRLFVIALAVASMACDTRAKRSALSDTMVQVGEGPFTMGCDEAPGMCMEGGLDAPAHSVWISTFWIDRTEVTRGGYETCVAARACTPPSGVASPRSDDALPVTGVSWEQAKRYCTWRQLRLPTEAEWEKAARGTDGRRYPWGNDAPRCDLANFAPCGGKLEPTGSLPGGASPYGALDLAGNAEEWVSDWMSSHYDVSSVQRDPSGPVAGQEHVVRGGSYIDDWWHLGATVRLWDSGLGSTERGFRCAK